MKQDITMTEASGAAQTRRKGRWGQWLALALVATLAGAGSLSVNRARQATALREAFLPDLESWAKREPNNGPVLAVLGGRRAQAGEFDAADEALQKALASGEDSDTVWLTLAATQAAAGDRVKSGQILMLARKQYPNSPGLRAALDRCRALPPTVPTVRLAEAIAPNGITPFVAERTRGSWWNGFAERQGHDQPESSGFATREAWAKQEPNGALPQRLWGEALTRNHRYNEAVSVLNHALSLDPNSPALHLALAEALRGGGADGKAGLEYIAALRSRPESLPALLGLGQVTLKKKAYSVAEDAYRRAIRLAPNNADAWIGLGRAQYAIKLKLDEALADFQKATQLAPARTDFFADYSNALRFNYRYDEAEAVLNRRLQESPDDGQAHFLLGLLLVDYKETPERSKQAEAEMRASLRISPDQPTAKARLGRLLVQRGALDEAMTLLEDVVQSDAYNAAAWQDLSRANRQAGHAHQADRAQKQSEIASRYVQRKQFLEDQLHRQPLNANINRQYARHLALGGDTSGAKLYEDAAYMLEHHRDKAERGIRALSSTMYGSDLPQQ